MKMDKVAGSGNDEFYTPSYAIEPLKKYLVGFKSIWCPFDTAESLFVKEFVNMDKDVTYSSLLDGADFFEQEVPEVDCIVSNPPYSKKYEVLNRLFSIGKPFAMLVGVVGLFESSKRFNMFKNNEFEIMYFNKRIAYFKSYEDEKTSLNPPFSSVYICHNILPSKIVFEEINKN